MEFKKILENNNCGLLIVHVFRDTVTVQSNAWNTAFYYHQPLWLEIESGRIKISIFSCILVLVEVVCAVANGFKNVCSDCIIAPCATTVEKPVHE